MEDARLMVEGACIGAAGAHQAPHQCTSMEVIIEKSAPLIQLLLFSWEAHTFHIFHTLFTPAQLGAVVLAPHVVGGVEDVARGDARCPQQQQEAVGPLTTAPDQWEAES